MPNSRGLEVPSRWKMVRIRESQRSYQRNFFAANEQALGRNVPRHQRTYSPRYDSCESLRKPAWSSPRTLKV
jgi:hypothetical protein